MPLISEECRGKLSIVGVAPANARSHSGAEPREPRGGSGSAT